MADQKLNIRIAAIDKTQKAFATVKRGLSAVTKAMFSFKASIVAAVGIGGLGLLVKKSLDGIDRISKLSRTLGIATNDLRKLELAAGLSGVELETLARGVRTLNAGMFDFVEKGTGTAVDAFGALGISAEELSGVMGDQFKVLELISDRLLDVENSATRSAIAQDLFGGRASELLLVLEEGSEGIARISKEAEQFGLTLSTVGGRNVEDASDAIFRLQMAFKGLRDTIVVSLSKAITLLADSLRGKLLKAAEDTEGGMAGLGQNIALKFIDVAEAITNAFIDTFNTISQLVARTSSDLSKFQKLFSPEYIFATNELAKTNNLLKASLKNSTQSFSALASDIRNYSVDELKSVKNLADAMAIIEKGSKKSQFQQMSRLLSEAIELKKIIERFDDKIVPTLMATINFDALRESVKATSVEAEKVEKATEAIAFNVVNMGHVKGMKVFDEGLLPDFALDDLPAVKFEVKEVTKAVDQFGLTMQDVAQRGIRTLEDAMVDLISGTRSAKDAFADMARSIIRDIIRMQVQQNITQPLNAAISGFFTPAGGGVGGGGGKAIGGAVQAGKPYMVGERGTEMFVPNQSGAIIPNNRLGGGNGVIINQTINVTTGVQQTVRAEISQLMPQISEATKAAVMDARRRGGSFSAAFG